MKKKIRKGQQPQPPLAFLAAAGVLVVLLVVPGAATNMLGPLRHAARSMCTQTIANLAHNQFATGGLAVLAGGTALAGLRQLALAASDAVLRRVVVRADFDSRDDSYRWMVTWLARHPQFRTARRFSVVTSLQRLGATRLDEHEADDADGTPVVLIPCRCGINYYGKRLRNNPQCGLGCAAAVCAW